MPRPISHVTGEILTQAAARACVYPIEAVVEDGDPIVTSRANAASDLWIQGRPSIAAASRADLCIAAGGAAPDSAQFSGTVPCKSSRRVHEPGEGWWWRQGTRRWRHGTKWVEADRPHAIVARAPADECVAREGHAGAATIARGRHLDATARCHTNKVEGGARADPLRRAGRGVLATEAFARAAASATNAPRRARRARAVATRAVATCTADGGTRWERQRWRRRRQGRRWRRWHRTEPVQ